MLFASDKDLISQIKADFGGRIKARYNATWNEYQITRKDQSWDDMTGFDKGHEKEHFPMNRAEAYAFAQAIAKE